jgi:hypothetical protein
MQSYRLILDTPIPNKINFSIVKMEGNIAEFGLYGDYHMPYSGP